MTIELLTKYARMIEEIREPAYSKRMAEYLLKITPNDLERKLAGYISRLENKYYLKPEDKFLMAIEEFERKGTIHSPISREELLEMVRKAKRETYL